MLKLWPRAYFLLKQSIPLVQHGDQVCLSCLTPQASVLGSPGCFLPSRPLDSRSSASEPDPNRTARMGVFYLLPFIRSHAAKADDKLAARRELGFGRVRGCGGEAGSGERERVTYAPITQAGKPGLKPEGRSVVPSPAPSLLVRESRLKLYVGSCCGVRNGVSLAHGAPPWACVSADGWGLGSRAFLYR